MTSEIEDAITGGAFDGRAPQREAVVARVDDSGGVQVVDVITNEGGVHAQVQVAQPWGFASNPPLAGLRALLHAIGGDPANWRAHLFSRARRLGALARGEVAMYADNGARVAIRQGGTIEVLSGSTVLINAPAGVTIVSGAGKITLTDVVSIEGAVTITGNLSVTGNINATGTIA